MPAVHRMLRWVAANPCEWCPRSSGATLSAQHRLRLQRLCESPHRSVRALHMRVADGQQPATRMDETQQRESDRAVRSNVVARNASRCCCARGAQDPASIAKLAKAVCAGAPTRIAVFRTDRRQRQLHEPARLLGLRAFGISAGDRRASSKRATALVKIIRAFKSRTPQKRIWLSHQREKMFDI
ncbi:MAG: hypothetical protein V7640_669 [Betaproteobacteria bacterium]